MICCAHVCCWPTISHQTGVFFPTCQVRVVRFYVSCPPPSSLLLLLVLLLAGPHLPALDRSGPRRTSSASSWSQWASPDLICQHLIAVGLAGPQLLARDRCGALWASPDLKRRDSEHCGLCWTSTGEILRPRGPRRTSTGPQRPETKPYRMPTRMPDRMPDRMSEDMPDRMSEDMPDRMSEDMPDGMPDRYAR